MQIDDFDQSVSGVGYLGIQHDGKAAMFISLYRLAERSVNDRADGNKAGYGLRMGAQIPIYPYAELFAYTVYQFGVYDKENVIFQIFRSDRQYEVTLGANFHLDKFWAVRTQVSYTQNNSNIAIYTFDRVDMSCSLRRDFR